MAHLPIASTSRLLLPSPLRPRPSSLRLLPPLRSSLGPFRSYARSSRASKVASTSLEAEIATKQDGTDVAKSGSKLQTIPFMCTPSTAIDRLEAAAHTALGLSSLGRLLWSRFARTFLGLEVELPAEMVAFKPLLVPTWRVDLCLTGRGILEEVEMDLFVSTTDASVPGFRLDPLDKLALISPWDAEPESYDPQVHNKQHDLDIAVIPFSRSPMGLLARLARMPRTNIPDHGINLDPKTFKPVLFAGYPLYLPIYLAEYVERAPGGRRLTCVALATSEKPTFTLYPSFLETPSWMPNGDSLELSVGGAPVDPADKFAPGALQKIAPQLDALVSRGQSVDFLDSLESWDEVERDPHVMAYGEFAESNREYLDKTQELATIQNTAKSLGALSDDNKTVVVSIKGVKVGKGKELKADVSKAVKKAELAVSFAKPEWLAKLEAQGEGKTLGGR